MQSCKRCLLPASYRTTTFDRDGVCKYCRSYDLLAERLTDYDALGKLLRDRIEKTRGRYPYDCLVGLSGGKDSAYVAYTAVKIFGLKTLACTFDNGWLTDCARNNIDQVVSSLGIDHFYYAIDPDLHREFYRNIFQGLGVPCPGCSFAIGLLAFRAAVERDIPIILHGRSRSQMFRDLAPGGTDVFLPFIKQNLKPYEPDAVARTFFSAMERIQAFMGHAIKDDRVRARFLAEFAPDLEKCRQKTILPEMVGLFLYQDYDEARMMDTLATEIGWTKPDNTDILTHNDCCIHDAVDWFFPRVFNYDLLAFELAVLIREGQISREEAQKRLEAERKRVKVPEKSLRIFEERLHFSRPEIEKILKRARLRNRMYLLMKKISNKIKKPAMPI